MRPMRLHVLAICMTMIAVTLATASAVFAACYRLAAKTGACQIEILKRH